jgi:hypothetical protein
MRNPIVPVWICIHTGVILIAIPSPAWEGGNLHWV